MNLGDLIKYYESNETNYPSTQNNNVKKLDTQLSNEDSNKNNIANYPKYVPYTDTSSQSFIHKKKPFQNKQQYSHRCEICDKNFKDQKKYDEHMASHVNCEHEGCNFSAPRPIMKHHELLHKNNMANLETPEEIAKYIEERKRKFPTRERIEMKRKEEEEKRKEMINNDNNPENKSTKKRKPCIYFRKGNCRFGDNCSFQHIKKRQRSNNFDDSDDDSDDIYPKSRSKLRKPKPVSPSELIQNMIKPAQMKEMKAILQCIHFIVENNFLQGIN